MYKKIQKNEKVHCESGDVLYLNKDTTYFVEGYFDKIQTTLIKEKVTKL